jgi:hypothetical protein
MKKLLVLAVTLVAAAGIGVAIATASPSKGALHVTKECSEYNGKVGAFCTVETSNVAAIPKGSKVVYLQAPGATTLDSDIVLVVGPGDYALGHVVLDFQTGTGEVEFRGGAGDLKSFRAKAAVTPLGGPEFAWDGKYHLSGDES